MDSERYPKDFLRRLADASCDDEQRKETAARAESGEVELSLGLSLNGCFGVDPKEKRLGLARSSSLAIFEHDFMEPAPIARTCSLPAEAPEELRKRKELQSLKRLEVKRKRSEKRYHKSNGGDSTEEGSGGEMDGGRLPVVGPVWTESGKLEVELNGYAGVLNTSQFGRPVNGVVPPGLPGWKVGGSGRASVQITSQLSVGSHGNAFTQLEHMKMKEDRKPLVVQSLPDHTNRKASPDSLLPIVGKTKTGLEELSKKTAARTNGARMTERNVMEEMPCVSTRGDGPNGRRIEGFLYRYRKGEDLRIVCVCHGSFLTPAEFVRHAGGGDVDQPLKHIVVYPTTSAFS